MYPSFKTFAEHLFAWRLFQKKRMPNMFYTICLYILWLIGITFLWIFIRFFLASSSSSNRSEYPSDKYKKVVKEGIFIDSVEWHER